jgi:ribosomal protein S18 acetylase RimI-like enzyme
MSFTMSLKITLRPAGVEDEAFLFDLFREVRAGRFDFHPGGHPQMAVMVRLQFEAFEHTLAVQHPGSEHSIILLDDVAVGRLRWERDETGFQLADISILPERQRKGIGTAVVKELMAEGLPVRCTVARANLGAVQFFRGLGFEVAEQDAAYLRMRV